MKFAPSISAQSIRAGANGKAALISAALVLCASQSALAQRVGYVNINAAPGGSGVSWATAYDSLHTALSDPTIDEVWVARGVYRPDASDRTVSFELQSGVEILGGFKGDETSRVQRDWVANETVLSGDLFGNDGPNFFNTFDNSFHVVSAQGVDETAILDGFTVIAGNAEPNVAPVEYGGGVFAPNAEPVLRNCRLLDHQAAKGGGVYASGAGRITIEDCSFENIKVRSRGGAGAVHLDLGIHALLTRCVFDGNIGELGGAVGVELASALITDCSFVNCGLGQRGGAIGGWESTIDVMGGTFTGNQATIGGAIGVLRCDFSLTAAVFLDNVALGGSGIGGAVDLYESNADIWACAFERNSALEGGAIRTNFSNLVIYDCDFEGNSATDRGGGLSFQTGRIEVRECSFVENTAGQGGAISLSLIEAQPGVPTLLACDFMTNHSGGTGGALYVQHSLISMMQCKVIGNTSTRGGAGIAGGGEFVNSIFVGNRTNGDFGGAIRAGGRLEVWQCTIAGNEAATSGGGIYYLGGDLLNIGNSVLWDNEAIAAGVQLGQLGFASLPPAVLVEHNCVEGGVGVGTGVGMVTSDPRFLDPRGPDLVYGTADDDLRLLSFSPCRDAGNNDLTPKDDFDLDGDGDHLEPLPYDIEGGNRFIEDYWMLSGGSGSPPFVDIGAFESMPSECAPDLDPNGVLDIFDFLAFQNLFVQGDPRADLDHSTGVGVFDIFDFLVFQLLFTQGCGP